MSLSIATPVRSGVVGTRTSACSVQLWTMPSDGSGLHELVGISAGSFADRSGPADQSGNWDPVRTTGSTLRVCCRDGVPGFGVAAPATSGNTLATNASTTTDTGPLRGIRED